MCLNHKVFASGSDDLKIKIWNYVDFEHYKTLVGHEKSIYALEQINEEELFSGSYDKTLKMWNWREGKIIASLNSKNQGILTLCRLNTKRIITAGDDHSILIWEWNYCNQFCIFQFSFFHIFYDFNFALHFLKVI